MVAQLVCNKYNFVYLLCDKMYNIKNMRPGLSKHCVSNRKNNFHGGHTTYSNQSWNN